MKAADADVAVAVAVKTIRITGDPLADHIKLIGPNDGSGDVYKQRKTEVALHLNIHGARRERFLKIHWKLDNDTYLSTLDALISNFDGFGFGLGPGPGGLNEND